MTSANNVFIEAEDEQEVSGQVVLGVPLTPKNIGIAVAVAGVLLAGFGIFKFVMPTIAQGNDLNTQILAKQQEIEQQDEKLSKKAQAEQELAQAQQRRAAVTALFADEATLETLVFDIEEQLNRLNTDITEDEEKARITKFQPAQTQGTPESTSDTEVVNDGSLGSAVNGKVRRRGYEVEFEGSFAQTRQFLIILERMQPMLVVQDLKTQLVEAAPVVAGEYKQGKFVPSGEQPQRRLKTSFNLSALMPLSQEQLDAAAASAAPPPDAQPPQ
ncbi:pilus assembly protein PilO [Limnoraphis robusta Tam1]|uniref:pilus assembly protein PilO n=1 Tax=Limnoraphis robusta TaxID=1118279 RepID=UPI002B201CF7|nr:pilus assembly protein PilO [Limnoraphis robusta]MEA5541667.1 pilus assembly protein PilO [Limnoraphis robusta Tam1]